MSNLLFFTLGLMIGGLTGITLMCFLRISQISDSEFNFKKPVGDKNENKRY